VVATWLGLASGSFVNIGKDRQTRPHEAANESLSPGVWLNGRRLRFNERLGRQLMQEMGGLTHADVLQAIAAKYPEQFR
jgi:hypothetical protein